MSTTIAIDCRLDYEIIFPENSKPSTDYQINVSLIKLAFNDDIATLPEGITCTLPESLKSQYEITGLFIDEEGTVPLTAGMTISTKDLTDMDTMNGVIIDGALTVYVKVELLSKSKYSITWKYKTSNNESTQEDTEVFENNLPIPPSFVQTFVTKENNILYKYSFASWSPTISEATKDCTYEATYDKTEYKPATPYLSNNVSLFETAVPYYYGSGSPYYNYYLPLGEDNQVEAPEDDIKVQMYSGDSYTVGENLGGFKINNYAITYIKKGTFPKLGEKSLIWSTDGDDCLGLNKADTPNDITNCILKGHYVNKKLTKLELIDCRYDSTNTNGEDFTNIFHTKYPNEFGENEIPTRIGFLLVAGGGGGGGVSYFTDSSSSENEKDGSSKNVTVPGAGGGGAAITMGVFNFDYPTLSNYSYSDSTSSGTDGIAVGNYSLWKTTDNSRLRGEITSLKDTLKITSVEFHITGGIGGAGNGSRDNPRGGNDEKTKDGKEGYDANIHIIINAEDSNGTKYWTVEPEKLPPKILKVCRGFGGQRGDYSKSEIPAGAGGIAYDNKSSSQLFHLASYPGGSGASVIIQSETGSAGPISEYNKSFYLSSDTPPAEYRIDVSHSGANPGGTADSTAWTACIFGGHSLGKGGIGEGSAPTKGGGGCSLKVTEGDGPKDIEDKNDSDINEPTNGANGYFGIYY